MKRRLLASRKGCFVLLGIIVLASAGYLFIYGRGAPPNDEHLIQSHFNPDLPGFNHIEVLKREVRQAERDLTIRVEMDGYPERLVCQGWLHYKSGDPYTSYVEWEQETCEYQFQMIWNAREYLSERTWDDPLREDADELAQLLKNWAEADLIVVSDIRNPRIRAMVSDLLGQQDQPFTPIPSSVAGYYEAGTEFEFELIDLMAEDHPAGGFSSPWSFNAEFLDKADSSTTPDRKWTDYHFRFMETNNPFTLVIKSAFVDRLRLVPGEVYNLVVQIQHGWPSVFGLTIKQEGELVFQGLTDWELGKRISTESLLPITVEQSHLLEDHYTEGDCWDRITNLEMKFAMQGEGVSLHQGEVSTLEDYQVHLEVARAVEYNDRCLDAGLNGISFTVSKR
ncbi:MAG: hypothetical protein PVG32_11120 [Anaerolineales bacterium]